MGLYLALGFRDESQAQRVAKTPRDKAETESPGIPERVQERRPRPQIIQSLARPGQMIGFLVCSFGEPGPQGPIARHGGLGRVERLGAHFTDVVHPHQRTGFAPLRLIHFAWRLHGGGQGPGGMWASKKRTQCRICSGQDGIQQACHMSI